MTPAQQRNTTLTIVALVALTALAFALRYYLDNREHFREVQQPATFVLSNGVAHFTTARGSFARTNADLLQLLTNAVEPKAIVTFRDRYRGDTLVGARATAIDIPHSPKPQ